MGYQTSKKLSLIPYIYTVILPMGFHMERKLRLVHGSFVITIPKQVCDLYRFKAGDMLDIEPIGIGELRLRKVIQ